MDEEEYAMLKKVVFQLAEQQEKMLKEMVNIRKDISTTVRIIRKANKEIADFIEKKRLEEAMAG